MLPVSEAVEKPSMRGGEGEGGRGGGALGATAPTNFTWSVFIVDNCKN